jgi:hypothetical protein
MDAFMARKVNAQTNIEKYNKLKLDSIANREDEKRKFSPVNSNKLREATLLKTGFDMTAKLESINANLVSLEPKSGDAISKKSKAVS